MGLRFYRRVQFPGGSVNLSKRGASVSLGFRGAHVTFGRRGMSTTVGIPGTGISYTHRDAAQSGIHTAPHALTQGQLQEIFKNMQPAYRLSNGTAIYANGWRKLPSGRIVPPPLKTFWRGLKALVILVVLVWFLGAYIFEVFEYATKPTSPFQPSG
jgi:hypothetical protein